MSLRGRGRPRSLVALSLVGLSLGKALWRRVGGGPGRRCPHRLLIRMRRRRVRALALRIPQQARGFVPAADLWAMRLPNLNQVALRLIRAVFKTRLRRCKSAR